MTARPLRPGTLIGGGKAMVEVAPVEGGGYLQGLAGDTLKTF